MAYIVPNKIQPREYSMGSGMDGASYGTDSDDDLKVFNIEHDDNGQWLNSNNGHPNTLYIHVSLRLRRRVFVVVLTNHRVAYLAPVVV